MAKISGTYEDNQGFFHVLSYDREQHEWTDWLHNPQWKYCSHTHLYPDQIRKYIQNMKKIAENKTNKEI